MKTIFICLFIIQSYFVYSQENIKFENALLWEITSNQSDNKSYLFGTVHLMPSDEYFFEGVLKEKFESCEILALETEVDIPLLKQISLAKKIMLPDNKTLADYMDSTDYKRYRNYILDTLGISEFKWNQIKAIKPLFATTIILTDIFPEFETYELNLNKLAKKKGMEVVGLETFDFQLDLLNSISIEDQIQMSVIDAPDDDIKQEFLNLIKMYKEQDLNKMLEMYLEEELPEEFGEELLVKRNSNWIPVIEKLVEDKSTFIAVGAMHLPGKEGVLNLLQKKGYILKPVSIK